jgi:hypothetical protein
MRTLTPLALILLTTLAACAHHQTSECRTDRPQFSPYYVPSAAIVNTTSFAPNPHPDQVLPASDGEYFFPRTQRVALGTTPLAQSTYYSLYTYDAQAISIPRSGGYGYQYRWIVQQGLALPPQ